MAPTDDTPPPVPDPTVLTTEQLIRQVRAERDYVNGQLDVLRERLNGIDRATELLSDTVNQVPTEVTKEVRHLSELMEERFQGVNKQFAERDTRSERESKDNKVAVDAAFAAQKEAASEQNKSNTLAITKSEVATAETINKLAELVRTQIQAMGDKIDDLKERVSRIESRKEGAVENHGETQATWASFRSVALVFLAVLTLGVGYLASRHTTPTPPVTSTLTVPTVITVPAITTP